MLTSPRSSAQASQESEKRSRVTVGVPQPSKSLERFFPSAHSCWPTFPKDELAIGSTRDLWSVSQYQIWIQENFILMRDKVSILSAQSMADSGVNNIMLTSVAQLPPDAQSITQSRIHSSFTGLHQLEAQLDPLIASSPARRLCGGGWMFSSVLYSICQVKQVKSHKCK